MIEKKFDEITVSELKDLDSFEVDGDYRLVRIDEDPINGIHIQRLSKEEGREIIEADDKIQKIREFIDEFRYDVERLVRMYEIEYDKKNKVLVIYIDGKAILSIQIDEPGEMDDCGKINLKYGGRLIGFLWAEPKVIE